MKVNGDEAYWWLQSIVNMSELPLVIWSTAFVISGVATAMTLVGIVLSFANDLCTTALLLCSAVLAALVGLGMLIVGGQSLLQDSFYGIGPSNALNAIVARTVVTHAPPGYPAARLLKLKLPWTRHLRHSAVYQNSAVTQHIAEWIVSAESLGAGAGIMMSASEEGTGGTVAETSVTSSAKEDPGRVEAESSNRAGGPA